METLIPLMQLLAVLESFHPQGQRGRPPVGLERMLRVYFLQQWYAIADEALEDASTTAKTMRGFDRVDLAAEGVPDATTIPKFRRLLETHDLCNGLFPDLTARPAQIKIHTYAHLFSVFLGSCFNLPKFDALWFRVEFAMTLSGP